MERHLPHKDHPVWPALRTFGSALILFVLLKNNANNFDMGEVKTIVELMVLVGALEITKRKVTK